jgi:hypothetical protein
MESAQESDTSQADVAVTAKVTLKDGCYAGEAIVKQTNFGMELPEKRASEPREKFELNSTCGWHCKTQGGQVKLIKGGGGF